MLDLTIAWILIRDLAIYHPIMTVAIAFIAIRTLAILIRDLVAIGLIVAIVAYLSGAWWT